MTQIDGDSKQSGNLVPSRSALSLLRRSLAVGAAVVGMVIMVSVALALGGAGDRTADLVLGQPNFTTGTTGPDTASAVSMGGNGIVIDSAGKIYVADQSNHRVLIFNDLADTVADFVLGQPNFTTRTANTGGLSANSMQDPYDIAIDSAGKIYVADVGNNRILVFNNLADTTADFVLGAPNFTTGASGRSATLFTYPYSIAVDSTGRLYVADRDNHRILVFYNLADTVADFVLGAPNFTSLSGGLSANLMTTTHGVEVDSTGKVYVIDQGNKRVLVFNNLADTTADLVLGQPDFTTGTVNTGGLSANSMQVNGSGLFVDRYGRLYVADNFNNRVLVFSNLVDTRADLVFGQSTFDTNTSNNGGRSARSLDYPTDIAVDNYGRVYVMDANNNRVVIFNDPFAIAATTLPVADISIPTDTFFAASPPIATTESFVQINLPQITTTTGGVLKTASNATGTNANYTCTSNLMNSGDSLTIPIWTNQGTSKLFLGVRSDTASLNASGLPSGISNTDTGRRSFGATVILTEFADATGQILGDSKTTTNIGNSFSYTLRYFLSVQTVALYRDLGFDTAPGSTSFRFYYADTYGGRWTEDATVTISVVAGPSSTQPLEVRVSGITKDLPGGLGGVAPAAAASSSTAAPASAGACLINSLFGSTPLARLFPAMRGARDTILGSSVGRLFVSGYYGFAISLLGFVGIFVGVMVHQRKNRHGA